MVQVGNPQAVPACLVREQSAWNLFAHNDSKAISQSFRGATRETFLDLEKTSEPARNSAAHSCERPQVSRGTCLKAKSNAEKYCSIGLGPSLPLSHREDAAEDHLAFSASIISSVSAACASMATI